MCTFGVLWLLCEAPAAPKPPAFHKSEILGGPAQGGPARECPAQGPVIGRTGGSNTNTQHQHSTTTHNTQHNNNTTATHQQHNNTQQHSTTPHITQQHHKNGLAKIGLPKSATTDAAHPFVRQFCGTPSQCRWEGDGSVHQGEGGERGTRPGVPSNISSAVMSACYRGHFT